MNFGKRILFLVVYTSLFLLAFISLESFFYGDTKNQYLQEKYIEKTKYSEEYEDLNTPLSEEEKELYKKTVLKKKIQDTSQNQDIQNIEPQYSVDTLTQDVEKVSYVLNYIPIEIQDDVEATDTHISSFLESDGVEQTLNYLKIEIYQKANEVRGKFKDKAVKLFGVLDIEQRELFAVFIHEFGHYIDLYFLEDTFTRDISDDFYDISWKSTKILKEWLKQSDFVSWYAMTNKYEDFAESFTYYTLHNQDFYNKALKSDVLMQKYDFLKSYVYPNNAFESTHFSTSTYVKNYYRDITKIEYDIEKFLQYLKNWI